MNKREEKKIRDAFERNLKTLKENGSPDLGDILRAGGIKESDIPQYRKYVLIYSLSEDVIKASNALLRYYKCSECGHHGVDCSGCVNKELRKAVRMWSKFDKEY